MADSKISLWAKAKADAEARSYQSQFGQFVDAADTTPVPIVFTNAKSLLNEIVYANEGALKLTGFERDDMISKPFATLLAEHEKGDRPRLDQIAEMLSPVVRCVRKSGAEYNATMSVTPVRDSDGTLDRYFISLVDISAAEATAVERRLVEMQTVQNSRSNAMGTMAATLAHELNQPLEAIANYAAGCSNILATSGFQSDQLDQGLKAIAEASHRAGNVIRRLRDMTRKQTPHSHKFALSDALLNAVQHVRASGCGDVSIVCQMPEPGWVKADAFEIGQVIVNLLRNACDASVKAGQGRTVTASISSELGKVRVRFHVEAPGIAAGTLDSMLDWSDPAHADEVGIGLSISRTILERYKGQITLDDADKNSSQFSLWLPQAGASKSGVEQ